MRRLLMTGMTTVLPAAGWRYSQRPADDEVMTPWQYRRILRVQREKDLIAILGACYVGTTILPRMGTTLGPAKDRYGIELKWSLWAPRDGVLIDIFRRILPTTEELEDRQQFATEHALRYAIVEPGQMLSLDRLREWLVVQPGRE